MQIGGVAGRRLEFVCADEAASKVIAAQLNSENIRLGQVVAGSNSVSPTNVSPTKNGSLTRAFASGVDNTSGWTSQSVVAGLATREQLILQLKPVEHCLQARVERSPIDPLLPRGEQVGTIEMRVFVAVDRRVRGES